jgi:hypothetical protein
MYRDLLAVGDTTLSRIPRPAALAFPHHSTDNSEHTVHDAEDIDDFLPYLSWVLPHEARDSFDDDGGRILARYQICRITSTPISLKEHPFQWMCDRDGVKEMMIFESTSRITWPTTLLSTVAD